jgi:pimeloyl-ACP methyl ester carboxylesterase
MPETVYLIPGLLCDDVVWTHQAEALGRDFDVRIPDLGGYASITAMAEAILADAPPRFSLAGHSMGARVALQIVSVAPERVERLALLDTGIHPPGEGEAGKRQILLDVSAQEGMTALADRWLPPMVREGTLADRPDLRVALYAMVERMSPAIHRNQISALLGRPDAGAVLPGITCPVLVGVGEFDQWSPPAQHEAIVAAIPHATYVVFSGSGHMAPMEAPEAVTAALTQWMQQPAPQPATTTETTGAIV